MKDAFFAGRVFVPGEQNGFRFFLWGDTPWAGHQAEGEMSFSSTFAEPADGAFLCKVSAGWIFVTGAGKNHNFRHTFTDDTPQAEANAQAMAALGIEILSLEEGNQRIRADGIAPYSITADEKRRQAARDNQHVQGKK